MVREHAGSERKGLNGKEVPSQWRSARVAKRNPVKKRKIKFAPRPRARGSRDTDAHVAAFRAKQTDQDRKKTTAVVLLQRRLKKAAGNRVGVPELLKTLTRSEKRRKPQNKGEKCIAIHQGCGPAVWEACFFENEVFPNNSTDTYCLMRRTDYATLADKKLGSFFAALSTEVFLVPPSFSKDWDLHYLPNSGVYVVESMDTGDIYVGSSKDIQRRIVFHNSGGGATFTSGGKWFRIAPVLSQAEEGSKYTQESQETNAQMEKARSEGKKIKVCGGFKCKTK